MGCQVGMPRKACVLRMVKRVVLLLGVHSGLARIPALAVSSISAICCFHASGCRTDCPRLL